MQIELNEGCVLVNNNLHKGSPNLDYFRSLGNGARAVQKPIHGSHIDQIKEAKRDWKLIEKEQPLRNDFIKAIVESHIPNFNLRVTVK